MNSIFVLHTSKFIVQTFFRKKVWLRYTLHTYGLDIWPTFAISFFRPSPKYISGISQACPMQKLCVSQAYRFRHFSGISQTYLIISCIPRANVIHTSAISQKYNFIVITDISYIATLGPNLGIQLCLNSCKSSLASWATKWHDYVLGTHPPNRCLT